MAPTSKACERALRPAVVQRKVTNSDSAMWAAEGEAAVRPVVDTARLTRASDFGTILKTVGIASLPSQTRVITQERL